MVDGLSLTEIVSRQQAAFSNKVHYNQEALDDLKMYDIFENLFEVESHNKITCNNSLKSFALAPLKDVDAIKFRQEITEMIQAHKKNKKNEDLSGIFGEENEQPKGLIQDIKNVLEEYVSVKSLEYFSASSSIDPELTDFRTAVTNSVKVFSYKNLLFHFSNLDESMSSLFRVAKKFAEESMQSESYHQIQTIENAFTAAGFIQPLISFGHQHMISSSASLLEKSYEIIKGLDVFKEKIEQELRIDETSKPQINESTGVLLLNLFPQNNDLESQISKEEHRKYAKILDAAADLRKKIISQIDLTSLSKFSDKAGKIRDNLTSFLETMNLELQELQKAQTEQYEMPDWAFLHDELTFLIELDKLADRSAGQKYEMCILQTNAAHTKKAHIKNANNLYLVKEWREYSYDSEDAVVETKSKRLVSNDIDATQEKYVFLLTGPNDAGKSTYLRTVGQIAWVHQLGGAVTATSGEQQPYSEIFTIFAQEDNPDEDLSKYAVDLNKVKTYFNGQVQVNPRTLFIMDEFGNGTNKEEANDRIKVIVDQCIKREATTYISFHKQNLAEELRKLHPQIVCLGLDDTIIEEGKGAINWNHHIIVNKISPSHGNLIRRKYGLTSADLDAHYEKYYGREAEK